MKIAKFTSEKHILLILLFVSFIIIHNGYCLIHEASQGEWDTVLALIESGADVNEVNQNNETAL